MATPVSCPHCGKRYQMQAEWAGKKLKCRACGRPFRVPAPAESAPLASGPQDLVDELLPRGAVFPLGDGLNIPPMAPLASPGPTLLTPVGSWHKRRALLRKLKIGGLVVGVVAVLAGVVVGGVFLVKAVWQNMPSFTSIPGESFAQEVLRFANDVADIMASIKDTQSARAAVPKLKTIKSRALDLAKRLEEVKKIRLTAEQNRELESRYRPKMEAVTERMRKEIERVQGIPGIHEALADAELAAFNSPLGPSLPFRFPSFARPSRTPPGMTPFAGPGSGPPSSSPPPELAVKADPGKFPEPIKPEATNPTHPDYVKANLAELKCPDPDRRSQAASRLATKQSTPALLEHLEGPDADLAKASLEILAKLKDPKAIEPVAHLLGNKALAHEAARMLIETGPAAEKAVITVAKTGEKDALAGAMTVLDKIGTAECIPVVIQAAAGSDTQASWAAFRILERVKDERSIVPMAELLVSIHHRHHAANVIKAIGAPAEDVMLKGLKLRDTQVVRECLGILGAIGTEKSLRPIKALRSRDRWLLDSARQAYAAIAARSEFAQGGFDTDGGSASADGKSAASSEPGNAGAKDPLMKGGFDTGPVEKGTKSRATVVE